MAEIKKTSISEELGDQALKNSELSRECREMKHHVNCSRKRRCKGGSSIDPKDKKNGKVKKFTKFEIEVENILRGSEKERENIKKVVSFTDMILDSISRWPELSSDLDLGGFVPDGQLHDERGSLRITVPWANLVILAHHQKQLEKLLGKEFALITNEDLRKNTSSLFSQIFKVFNLLGLACKEKVKVGLKGANSYQFDKRLYRYSLSQLHYLLEKGRELQRRIKRGELKVEQQEPKKFSRKRVNGKRVLEIPTETDNAAIAKRTVEVLPDGSVRITSWFK